LLSKNLKIEIYEITILPVVLYGRETWSLTLREEHKLRMFENSVLRRIFEPKRDGVMGGWRKLHNEELRDLYSFSSINRMTNWRKVRCVGHVARIGEKRKACILLMGKPERERICGPGDGIRWVQNGDQWRALANAAIGLPVPYSTRKLPSGCTSGSLSS
jgi:hypothetical protein